MKKFGTILLTICAFTAFALPKTEFSLVSAQNANDAPISFSTEQTGTLLSPTSYEQYLSLSAPADVAVTESYVAIADGFNVYFYDRAAGEYLCYSHTATVTKLQFDKNENLYFLDSATDLHFLDTLKIEENVATETGLNCSSFLIEGNSLYFTRFSGLQSQISKTTLGNLGVYEDLPIDQSSIPHALAFSNGALYYSSAGKYLHKTTPGAPEHSEFLSYFSDTVASMVVSDNRLAMTTTGGDFYVYDLENFQKELFKDEGGYKALTLRDGNVYTVQNRRIRQFSLQQNNFTSYEICDSSDSLHRFNGATNVYATQDKLFIADNGNERISVYLKEENAFAQPIFTDLQPTLLCADANTLLIANRSRVELYDLTNTYGELLHATGSFNGEIVGVENVYGTYYLVTDKNAFYSLSRQANAWKWESVQKNSTRYPSLLATDFYGNLYVTSDNAVYLYKENNFLSPSDNGVLLCETLPEKTMQLRVDYARNLYALTDTSLYFFEVESSVSYAYKETKTYSFNEKTFVYGDAPNAIAFTLSVEENAAYVLYDEDYLVLETKLHLPTVTAVPVNGADENIFREENAQFTIVQIPQNTVIVHFDIAALQENKETFAYLSYERNQKEQTALMIGETDGFYLVAIFDEQTRTYDTCLIKAESCEKLSNTDYYKHYGENETFVAYVSNSIPLYKFPYLTDLLTTVTTLPRGLEIKVLGEITKLDQEYYHILFVDETGTEKTGYVPKSYVTETNGETTVSTPVYGATESDVDAYGRLIYLLLGTGIICILIDFLLLRKPKDNE